MTGHAFPVRQPSSSVHATFNIPTGVKLIGNRLLVSESRNDRVLVFDRR